MSKKQCNNVPVRVCPDPNPPAHPCAASKIGKCLPDQVVIETIRKALNAGPALDVGPPPTKQQAEKVEEPSVTSFLSAEQEIPQDYPAEDVHFSEYAEPASVLRNPKPASFAQPKYEPPIQISKRKTAFPKLRIGESVRPQPSTQTNAYRSKRRLSTYKDPENFGLMNEHQRNSSFVLLKKTPNEGLRPTVKLVRLSPVPVVRQWGIRELNEIEPPTYFEELTYWKTGPGREYYSNATINMNSANPSIATVLSEDKIALVNGQYSDPSQIEFPPNSNSNEGYYQPHTDGSKKFNPWFQKR